MKRSLAVGGVVALAAAAVVLLSACPGPSFNAVPMSDAIPECPQDTLQSDFVLPGPTTRVPEFHDCQRFIRKHRVPWGHDKYEGLYAVFARMNLDKVVFTTITTTLNCVPAAGGVLRNAAGQICTSSSSGTASASGIAVPVALIYTPDGDYPTLGITVGFNCLYLYNPPAFQAVMHHVTHQEECFETVNPATLSGLHLSVRVVPVTGFNPGDYPAVSRWDRVPGGNYFVSMRCGTSWCEIGPLGGFGVSPALPPTTGTLLERRVTAIKGWYDEQILAGMTSTGVSPSGIRGIAVPDPALQTRGEAEYDAAVAASPSNPYLPASKSALEGGPPGLYLPKLNFEQGSFPGEMNTVEMCRGDITVCVPASERAGLNCSPTPFVPYFARITSAVTHTVKYRCMKYMQHLGVDIPGTVRWRWLKNDETQWIRCPAGCCTIE